MTWNYRVVKNGIEFGIYEVYYDGDAQIMFLSEFPEVAYGETLDELLSDYARMAEAFKKPVIDYDTLEEIEI